MNNLIQYTGFENHFSEHENDCPDIYWYGTSYSFALSPEYYNGLPIKVKKFLYRAGNYLHYNATHTVEIKLMDDKFRLFNEMLWNQIGHS